MADGERAVVSRYISRDPDKANSLYLHSGGHYVCEGGVCQMVPASKSNHAVIVASEPLSDDSGWQGIAPNHRAVVHEELQVERRRIEYNL